LRINAFERLHFIVTRVTAADRVGSYVDGQRAKSSASVQRLREFIMTSTITTAVTVFFVVFGVYAANLVVYHPQQGGLNPTTPVSLTVDWK
jgi:hypothetical protein